MNKYEAMFIFPVSFKEEEIPGIIEEMRNEVVRSGGQVTGVDALGRRSFARTMQKQGSGYYARIRFEAPADSVASLQARLRLKENIFRCQVVRAEDALPVPPAAPAEEGAAHGKPQ